MKIRIGLRTIAILMFLILISVSLSLVFEFFMHKQQDISDAVEAVNLTETFSKLHFASVEDSIQAKKVMGQFGESRVLIKMTLQEVKLYSAVYLVMILLLSALIFILVMNFIFHPLRELRDATIQIRRGNFSVHLKETGIAEMRELKRSFNDMSYELNTTQNRLLVAEKEMIWKDLSRILAHEIKNPLTPIQLTIQRLEEKFESDPEKFKTIFPDAMHIVNQEIENLRALSQDFSSFAKINQPQSEVFDPSEVLQEIIDSYRSEYTIHLNLSSGHLIRFDRMHFYQIVTNILQNALDASHHESPIDISLEVNHGYVVLTIRDHGSGIDPEDLPRIFEPYFSKKNRGTGLGLALVKRLLDANKSFVRVKSKPGDGSQFEILMEETCENPDH